MGFVSRGVWCGVLLCLAATPALAQVETVVVTARPPDPVGNDAFSVENVDAETIHSYQQLDRALEQVPGLSTFRRDSCLSANPTTQGVSLRSIAPSGASRALVTLDGVPQNDPFGGWVLWCSLPPEDIQGAEVVRGAGAGPYGASALTGVIALDEAGGEGLYAADASAGSIGLLRAAGAGGTDVGPFEVFGSISTESTSGWNPIAPGVRAAGDDNLTVDARNASLRIGVEPLAGIQVIARGNVYDENRHSGLVGATSEATGGSGSLTISHPQEGEDIGWRVQAWLRDTDFVNESVSAPPAPHTTTTPSNDEHATPAVGWGVNGEVRGKIGSLSWATGFDARETSGETRERFSFNSGHFTMNRFAGGQTFVGGVYVEAADRFDGWLVTAGLRADDWASTGGHLRQSVISSGTVTLNQHFASRTGTVPTARVGIRHDFGDFYVRAAGYEGFRPPTLNELYRPFRQGNNFTFANANLTPEKLYGGEIGAGGDLYGVVWNATLFWNKLQNGIANVTIGHGPGTFPAPAGFIPSGGLVIQRENVGDIDAYGIEGDARYPLSDNVNLTAAFDVVDAHIFGGSAAPLLDGQQPTQAPKWTITAGVDARVWQQISINADLRYESTRFADDQNTLALPPATTVDAKVAWHFAPSWSVYVAADNLFNADVATTEAADGTVSYDFPRIWRAGVQFER
jgi:outer membrane receptor protein involved in Fe transport